MDNGFAEGYAVGQGNANNNGWGNGAWGAEWLWIIVLLRCLVITAGASVETAAAISDMNSAK